MEHVHVLPTILCFRCSAEVPNGLIRKHTLQTGYSKHPTDLFATRRYETVNLCGVCDQQVVREELAATWSSFRIIGVIIGTIALTMASVPWPISLTIMVVLGWFHVVGLSLLVMFLLAKGIRIETIPPAHYLTHFVEPWALLASGIAGVKCLRQLRHTRTYLVTQKGI